MVQACLPAVPRIKTVTDGLGSERTEHYLKYVFVLLCHHECVKLKNHY